VTVDLGHPTPGDVAARRFTALARHCTDVVSVLDLATRRWTYVSPSVVRQTGYTADEVLGQRVGATLGAGHARDDLQHSLRERIAALEAGDESRRVEVSEVIQLHRSGDPMRCEVTTILVTDDADRCVEMVCVSRDVLAQRLAAEEVRASEVRFRSLVEQMPIGVLYQDSLGRIIMSNPAARQMTGLSDDAVTIGDIELLHENGTPFTADETPGRRAIASTSPATTNDGGSASRPSPRTSPPTGDPPHVARSSSSRVPSRSSRSWSMSLPSGPLPRSAG
jgi:PAS domain S-box-containing protein